MVQRIGVAHDRQVDLVAADVVVRRVGTIDQRVDGVAKRGRVDTHLLGLQQQGRDMHLGIAEVETWHRAGLGIGDQRFTAATHDLAHDLAAERDQSSQAPVR